MPRTRDLKLSKFALLFLLFYMNTLDFAALYTLSNSTQIYSEWNKFPLEKALAGRNKTGIIFSFEDKKKQEQQQKQKQQTAAKTTT